MYNIEHKYQNVERQLELDKSVISKVARHTPMLYKKDLTGKKIHNEGLASSIYVIYRGQEYLITVGHLFIGNEPKDLFFNMIDVPLSQIKSGVIYEPDLNKDDFKEMDHAIFL